MNIRIGKNSGFCFGVLRAIDLAKKTNGKKVYTYGEIIHNGYVVDSLKKEGINVCNDIEELKKGDTLVIRSHGVPKNVLSILQNKGINVVDATCPFVKKTQDIVREKYENGYQIVIIGEKKHPEIIGINGWCDNFAVVIEDEKDDIDFLVKYDKICVVVQTTFDIATYKSIVKNIKQLPLKIVEIFDTICYTTYKRQEEAKEIALASDAVIVIGGFNSSNTNRLNEICKEYCKNVVRIEKPDDLNFEKLACCRNIGIVAGASTPIELIKEVKFTMEDTNKELQTPSTKDGAIINQNKNGQEDISMEDVMNNLDKKNKFKRGQLLEGTIAQVNNDGVLLCIGSKTEVLVPDAELSLNGDFDKNQCKVGELLQVKVVSNSGKLVLSRKAIEEDALAEEKVQELLQGKEFTMSFSNVNKGGLKGSIGSYNIFVPGSQIKIGYVNEKDFIKYKNKKLRLVIIKEDGKDLVASQRVILEREKKDKDDDFWANIEVGKIVKGKVLRFAKFGAFVSVDGYDCLAHISDLSWSTIKTPSDVLELNKEYDFVILNAERENNRVSLGYKQLQKRPIEVAYEKYPKGTVLKGKVVRLVSFGAFVNIGDDMDGLVHISQVSNDYVDNIGKVLNVGDEVEVAVLDVDVEKERINLSIKATLPAPEQTEEEKPMPKKERAPRKSRKEETSEGLTSWVSDDEGTSIADLTK